MNSETTDHTERKYVAENNLQVAEGKERRKLASHVLVQDLSLDHLMQRGGCQGCKNSQARHITNLHCSARHWWIILFDPIKIELLPAKKWAEITSCWAGVSNLCYSNWRVSL